MTLKTRRIIFYLFAVLFLLAATAAVFYSLGYRFDLRSWQVMEVGGIYIKSAPAKPEILLNGKPVKGKSGIFQAGTLITNLTPGSYSVHVQKSGYYPWEKEVTVKSGNVASFDYVILAPKTEGALVASSTLSFYVQDSRIIRKTKSGLLFGEARIPGDEVISFTSAGTVISVDKDEIYYLSNIFDLSSSLNLNAVFNNLKQERLNLPGEVPVVQLAPFPFNDRKFIVMSKRAIYSVDTERLTIEQLDKSASKFTLAGSELIWANEAGIHSFNLVFRTRSTLSPLPQNVRPESIKELDASPSGALLVILKDNGELMLFSRKTNTFTTLSRAATSFAIAPNEKSVVFLENDRTLFSYFLTDFTDERRENLLTRIADIPGARNLVWHKNSAYLFVLDRGDSLRFIEISPFPPANEAVIETGVKRFAYDAARSTLYYDDGESIRQIVL